MTTPAIQADIERFFHGYNDAFIAVDGARIADFYHFPCLLLRGDGELLDVPTVEEGKALFQRIASSYHEEGNRASIFSIVENAAIGGRSVLATLDWTLQREDGSAIRGWRQSYNLVSVNGGWHIVLSTFHIQSMRSRPADRAET
ncbi:MAG: hypothetical protein L0H84_15485 [Pseudonocardia sp.]|nr:hypothetical protein [Pseudonocardia sp.]